MRDIVSSASDLLFKTNQIICLEYQHNYLYGEVIQLIPDRKLCWFRPMCLVQLSCEHSQAMDVNQIIDLQSGSDLLWPMNLFRPALDTEVISLLSRLEDLDETLMPKASSRQYLNKFVRQVWQANKDKF